MGKFKVVITAALISLVGFLIGGEILTRLLYRPDHWLPMPDAVEHGGYYTYLPFKKMDFYSESVNSLLLSFDENGLRNPPGSLKEANILLLGDSFTSVISTPDEVTLAEDLRRKGFKIYNAGVDGYSTFKAYELLKSLLKLAHPKLVILDFYMGNDFFDNQLDPLSDGKSSYLKLPGVPQTGLCSLSRLCQFAHQKIYLGFFLNYPTTLMELYAVKEMDSLQRDYDAEMSESVEKTKKAIGAIALLLKEQGIQFMVLGIPSKAQVGRSFLQIRELPAYEFTRDYAMGVMDSGYSFDKPDQVLGGICQELGVAYYSLLEKFRAVGASEVYFQIDSHWNEKGQSVAADFIAGILQYGDSRPSLTTP